VAVEKATHRLTQLVQTIRGEFLLVWCAVGEKLRERRRGRSRVEPRDRLRDQLVDVSERSEQAPLVVGLKLAIAHRAIKILSLAYGSQVREQATSRPASQTGPTPSAYVGL
jgi:hypothetical protein